MRVTDRDEQNHEPDDDPDALHEIRHDVRQQSARDGIDELLIGAQGDVVELVEARRSGALVVGRQVPTDADRQSGFRNAARRAADVRQRASSGSAGWSRIPSRRRSR